MVAIAKVLLGCGIAASTLCMAVLARSGRPSHAHVPQ